MAKIARLEFPAGGDVHLWQVPVEPVRFEDLNEAEQNRARRFQQRADADRFGTARFALRRLGAAYLGIDPGNILISGDRNKKPVFINKILRSLHFNTSHSGALVLIAFAEEELGVDIEQIDPQFDPTDLLPEHFSVAERSMIAGSAEPLETFYQLWTRKEALTKAWGTGLQEELRTVPVSDEILRSPGEATRNWRLTSFLPEPGYAAAVACNVSTGRIVFYRAI